MGNYCDVVALLAALLLASAAAIHFEPGYSVRFRRSSEPQILGTMHDTAIKSFNATLDVVAAKDNDGVTTYTNKITLVSVDGTLPVIRFNVVQRFDPNRKKDEQVVNEAVIDPDRKFLSIEGPPHP